MSRGSIFCKKISASGPMISILRNGLRSISAACSRQAQYSATAPWVGKELGSQKFRYSVKLRVSAELRGWKPVSRVVCGGESGVIRYPIERLKKASRG